MVGYNPKEEGTPKVRNLYGKATADLGGFHWNNYGSLTGSCIMF